ncbi:MAG: NHL repeat-containing protein [Bryocella sp.]
MHRFRTISGYNYRSRDTARLAFSILVLCALNGCGLNPSTGTSSPVSVQISAGKVSGLVRGGQQPVANVALQLYAIGTTGYGSAATPLLPANSVMTTASGNFTFPTFTCPTANSLVYLVGTGGQPIAAANGNAAVTNNNLALMVGLGACSMVANQFINMNELTTVATVWALSPFMTGIANIGTSPSNRIGIRNSFAAINSIVNTSTGALLASGSGLPSSETLPTAEINTLADILAYCVNSAGGSASDTTDGHSNGTNCGKLFYLAGGSTTSDTITAAMQIAQNPTRNIALLNNLRDTSPPFQSTLDMNSPPSAWTIMINYTGGGLNAPSAIATDSEGNVWLTNAGNNSVSKFQSNGTPLSSSTGFTAGGFSVPSAISIDTTGNVWVTNKGNNTITVLDPTGSNATVYQSNGLNLPNSIAIDAAGDAWVTNSGDSTVSVFTNTGSTVSGSPFSGGGISSPTSIAINPK